MRRLAVTVLVSALSLVACSSAGGHRPRLSIADLYKPSSECPLPLVDAARDAGLHATPDPYRAAPAFAVDSLVGKGGAEAECLAAVPDSPPLDLIVIASATDKPAGLVLVPLIKIYGHLSSAQADAAADQVGTLKPGRLLTGLPDSGATNVAVGALDLKDATSAVFLLRGGVTRAQADQIARALIART